jgi:aldose 1-epimerase
MSLIQFKLEALRYRAHVINENGVPVVRLFDDGAGVEVAVVPSVGNRAIEMRIRGKNILYFPFESAAELKRDSRGLNGIPFLAPWGNRMGGGGFTANGKRFTFNVAGGELRTDANGLPIHGMLSASPLWEIVGSGGHEDSAYVTCRLAFWKHPELMANWPFAHEYEMTYRLADGALEVAVVIRNLCAEAMPVAIGFHPYFELPGARREDAVVSAPVRKHVEADGQLLATGEFTDADLPASVSLGARKFDDGFTDLSGRVFSVEGDGKRIEVEFGPKYPVAIIYAPSGHNYICFEPMAAVTNGVNLAAEGKYSELQWVGAEECWAESFWVRGFGI